VNVFFPEAANDRLTVNGLAGDDVLNASSLEADGIKLTLNGGAGEDVFLGSEGDDLINGGDGNDAAFMGAGNDVLVWNPGDDDDTVEGQGGIDTLDFNGANVNENIDIAANGNRVLFTRNIANVTMDLNDVETVSFDALGGTDNIVINDLSGTDVTTVDVNLAGTVGGSTGDGAADTIFINGTNGDDVILIVQDGSKVRVLGLATEVTISNFDVNDRLVINGLGGDDVVEASGLGVGLALTANGGDGDDILVGGAGNDTFNGEAGDDVLIGGPGTDVLDGGAGNNLLLQ
jgi:Ca2+-binding RTX toxin-like protein